MALARLDVNDKAIRDAFAGLIDKVERPKPLLHELGQYLLTSTRRRFETMIDPHGLTWAPLSPKYVKRKKKNKARILVYEGRLMGTLAYQLLQGSVVGVEWGSPLVYASTHQFGRGNIPAREFLGLDSHDRKELLDIAENYLDEDGR